MTTTMETWVMPPPSSLQLVTTTTELAMLLLNSALSWVLVLSWVQWWARTLTSTYP
jgi:hypothetical protein